MVRDDAPESVLLRRDLATAEEKITLLRAENVQFSQRLDDLENPQHDTCKQCGRGVSLDVMPEHLRLHEVGEELNDTIDRFPVALSAPEERGQGHLHLAKRTVILMAGGGWGSTLNPSVDPSIFTPGNQHDYWDLAFNNGADDHAFWNLIMPMNWDGGEFTFQPYWRPAGGGVATQTVTFKCYAEAYKDGDNLENSSFDLTKAGRSNDVWQATNAMQKASESSGFRAQRSPEPGSYVIFIIVRDVSDADSLGVSARLLGSLLSYNTFRFSDKRRNV